MKEVSDELSKKELEDLAHLLKIDMKSKETKKTLVAKINDKIEELNDSRLGGIEPDLIIIDESPSISPEDIEKLNEATLNPKGRVVMVGTPKAPKLTHSTGELMDDVRKVGFKGYHPVTGKPI